MAVKRARDLRSGRRISWRRDEEGRLQPQKALVYRYGRWGRAFAMLCPLCDNLISCPFNRSGMWELCWLIIRRIQACDVCGARLSVPRGHIVIEEDPDDEV